VLSRVWSWASGAIRERSVDEGVGGGWWWGGGTWESSPALTRIVRGFRHSPRSRSSYLGLNGSLRAPDFRSALVGSVFARGI